MSEHPVVINYADPNTQGRDTSVLYRWAIGLTLFPFFGGIAIFLLFLVTSAAVLTTIGFYWLGVGILCVTASGILALVHAARDWSAGIRSRGKVLRRFFQVV